MEACVRDDLKSGQLVRGDGTEEWTSPAFVVRYPKVRMVADYRRVNARTRRSVFIIPRGHDQKAAVAPAHFVTMLDAVSGFNHLPNTHRACKMLALVTLSGIYQPVNLPFGPLNGPEDFKRVMHNILAVDFGRGGMFTSTTWRWPRCAAQRRRRVGVSRSFAVKPRARLEQRAPASSVNLLRMLWKSS